MKPLDQILCMLKTGPKKPEDLALQLQVSLEALLGMVQMLESKGYLQWVTSKHMGCQRCAVKVWCALPTDEGCDCLGLTGRGLERVSASF